VNRIAKQYRVTCFGRPIALATPIVLDGTPGEPSHADMLRYDGAFCNAADLSMVVFPIWNTPHGKSSRSITLGRWQSFSMKLEEVEAVAKIGDDWFTYVATGPNYKLVRMTMGEYFKQHPKYKLTGWR